MVIAPAPQGTPSDVEIFQTYASGPWSEVNSIIWPNPDFDNNITVYGPEVKALVTRYLKAMMGELTTLPNPNGGGGSLIDAIDLVVPHQANKNMVLTLAEAAGMPGDRIFFNIEHVGNTSSAKHSAWRCTTQCAREESTVRCVFSRQDSAPGAVGGYVVMRVDPAVVDISAEERNLEMANAISGNGNFNGDIARWARGTGYRLVAGHRTRDRVRTGAPGGQGRAELPIGRQACGECGRGDRETGW